MKSQSPSGAPGAPYERLIQLIMGYRATQLIQAAAALGLADRLAAGPLHGDELAPLLGAHPQALLRLLRALTSLELLTESADGRFALTPLGGWLRTDAEGSLHPRALLAGSAENWRPWGELLHTVRTGLPAFQHVFGMDQAAYLAQQPGAAEQFDASMTAVTERAAAALVAGYDFSPFRVIVDLGGGHGALLAEILSRNPAARGVLFDLPHVVAGAGTLLAARGVAERCERVPGDFFSAIPRGGDAYILKWILHGWEDGQALQILQGCRAAMAPDARLVLVEAVLPSGNEPDPYQIKLRDVHMMLMAGGRERTAAEFRALLAEGGFALTQVRSTSSQFSILEAVPA